MWDSTLQEKHQELEIECDDEAESEIEAPLPLTVTSRVSQSVIFEISCNLGYFENALWIIDE
jgi:hypothetical protein